MWEGVSDRPVKLRADRDGAVLTVLYACGEAAYWGEVPPFDGRWVSGARTVSGSVGRQAGWPPCDCGRPRRPGEEKPPPRLRHSRSYSYRRPASPTYKLPRVPYRRVRSLSHSGRLDLQQFLRPACAFGAACDASKPHFRRSWQWNPFVVRAQAAEALLSPPAAELVDSERAKARLCKAEDEFERLFSQQLGVLAAWRERLHQHRERRRRRSRVATQTHSLSIAHRRHLAPTSPSHLSGCSRSHRALG
jgi:hypothetical protein